MPAPIEHSLPDPHTYTIVINERMRQRIARALGESVLAFDEGDVDSDDCQMDMILADMFADTNLAVSPAVNGFVL